MTKFVYTVVVETDDRDNANTVMVERTGYDEQYDSFLGGEPFNYSLTVLWNATREEP
jgi:hypothetical protein